MHGIRAVLRESGTKDPSSRKLRGSFSFGTVRARREERAGSRKRTGRKRARARQGEELVQCSPISSSPVVLLVRVASTMVDARLATTPRACTIDGTAGGTSTAL